MSETYSVKLLDLENAIENARQISSNIANLLDSLETDLKGSLASWTGSAQEQYYTAQQAWHSAAQTMPASLGIANNTLESIAVTYDTAERQAIQSLPGS